MEVHYDLIKTLTGIKWDIEETLSTLSYRALMDSGVETNVMDFQIAKQLQFS